jgi:hypothetical protein
MIRAMQQWMNRLAGDTQEPDQKVLPRSDERFPSPGVACPLGTLVDLSASGARIRSDDEPMLVAGDEHEIRLTTGSQRISVPAVVKWVRSPDETDSRAWELGIAFEDQRPGVRGALEELAGDGRITGSHTTARDVGAFQPARVEEPHRTPPSDPVDRHVREIEDNARLGRGEVEVEFVDLYALLGVERNADADAIRSAYHAIAKDVHPDRSPEPEAEARFIAANKAYRVLSSDDMRRRYDDLLRRTEAPGDESTEAA